MERFRFVGQVALVIGGGHGLGSALCQRFSDEGSSVVCADINIEAARETTNEIAKSGGNALALAVDVTQHSQVQRLVSTTIKSCGKIDILVNNITFQRGVITTAKGSWDEAMDTNLKGPYMVAKTVIPHMMERKYGKIVNVVPGESVAARASTEHAICKSGMVEMTRLWAGELAAYHINVNCVVSRYTLSPPKAGTNEPSSSGGDIDSATSVVLFLSSSESDCVTGQTLLVDYGPGCFIGYEHEYRDYHRSKI